MLKIKNKTDVKFTVILIIIISIILIILMAPFIAPNDPYETNLNNILSPPSREYLFGTDSLGRCVFSRVLYGGSKSLFSALLVVFISFIIGSSIGTISGFIGGKVDDIFMSIVDIFLAFPGMIISIAISGILGGGLKNAMISIILISWTKYARLARSETLTIKNQVFIQASILSGKSKFYIILKHILPNILSVLIVTASLDIGVSIIELAGLSFLGLSSPLPTPEWGSMMNEGRSMLQYAPWVTIAPGIVMLIVILLFNLLGDSIYEKLSFKQGRNN